MLEAGKTKFHIDLRRYLREEGEDEALIHLICEIAEASKYIINSIRTGDLGVAGTSNLYGEQQLTLDVLSDRIMRKRLAQSGVVTNVASEEGREIVAVAPHRSGNYSVAYDPLDGSSLVDVNLAVGTIASIYLGADVLQPGIRQAAALYILYGPRTTLVYTTGKGVHEFGMNQLMEYTLLRRNVRMAPKATIYAPGGLRSRYTAGTTRLVNELEANGVKLRYSGGLVPDINQLLMKGSGIFFYPHLQGAAQGKLRLLFELNPMALLVEQAGGAASTGRGRVLEVVPEKLDEVRPFFCGCREDVSLAETFIAQEGRGEL